MVFTGCQCLVPVKDCSREPCGPPPRDAGPLREFFERVPVEVTCGNYVACGFAAPGTPCDVLTWGSRFGVTDPVEFEQRIDAGAIAFDLDAGLACLAAYQTTCDPDCWPPWHGLLEEGAVCESAFDCQPGLWCRGTQCPFRCAARLGHGAETPHYAECGTESAAMLVDGGMRCLDPIPFGADCSSAVDERPYWRACEGALRCGLTADGGRRCRTALALGATCLGDDCGLGLQCRGRPLRCVATANVAERCLADGGTLLPSCFVGLRCSNGVCVPPQTTVGAPCGRFRAECAPPLWCNLFTDTCQLLSNTGGACGSQFDCGNFLDDCFDGRCSPATVNGSPCATHQDCSGTLTCVKGRCGYFSCP